MVSGILTKIKIRTTGDSMRKAIGWVLSWILYWLGDLVSKPMEWFDFWWLYPVYNRLMTWSLQVQDWCGNTGPWKESNG